MILTAENPESKQALIDLVNSSLRLVGGETVVDLTVINSELPVDSNNYKKARFDIRARFQNGEQGIIEVEWGKKDNFKKRSRLIISKAYSDQDISNKTYNDLKRCYLICIVDHTLFEGDEEYFRDGIADKSKRDMLNKIMEKEEGVSMATHILQTISKDERERLLYQSHLIYELDQRSAERNAELRGKREVAMNFKKDGIPLDIISKNTGFSLEEIMAL